MEGLRRRGRLDPFQWGKSLAYGRKAEEICAQWMRKNRKGKFSDFFVKFLGRKGKDMVK